MTEYIVVSDKNSKVLFSSTSWGACTMFANKIRAAGGAVTVFKSTKL